MEKRTEFSGKNIYYETLGSGMPLVLLHGYLESLRIWDGFAEELAKSFKIIAVDLPGHGRSEVLGDTHTMEDMTDVVKQVIAETVPGERVLLTGHSLGGYVSLAFVERYPELLTGFCLFHSHPLADSEEVKKNRMREIGLVEAGKKELICQVNIPRAFAEENVEKFRKEVVWATEIAKHTPDRGIQAMLRGMMLRPDRRDVLEKGNVPALWILGKGDRYILYDKIIQAVHPSGNVAVSVLEHSGHMGFIEEKAVSLKIITGFADRIRLSAG